jgi:hypothetical protein
MRVRLGPCSHTRVHAGPETRITAMAARPAAVDRAYIVGSPAGGRGAPKDRGSAWLTQRRELWLQALRRTRAGSAAGLPRHRRAAGQLRRAAWRARGERTRALITRATWRCHFGVDGCVELSPVESPPRLGPPAAASATRFRNSVLPADAPTLHAVSSIPPPSPAHARPSLYTMASDDLVWSVIGTDFCSFKLKTTKDQVFWCAQLLRRNPGTC